MKFRSIGLLSLLSCITLLNDPVLSMRGEDEKGPTGIVPHKAKMPLTTERRNLEAFLDKQDYPGAFRSMKASLSHVSDEEIVNFLMTSNKYPGWDTVDPNIRGWVVAKITKEAKRKDLENFLSKQDYSGAFSATKAALPHVSAEEIVNFLMTSNKYPGWAELDHETKAWVAVRIIGKSIKEFAPPPSLSPVAVGKQPLPEAAHIAPAVDEVDEDLAEALRLSLQLDGAPVALSDDDGDVDFAWAIEGAGGPATLPAEHDADFARVLELSRLDTGGPAALRADEHDADLVRVLELSLQDVGTPAGYEADLERALELSRREKAAAAPKTMLEEFQQWAKQAGEREGKHDATTTQFTLIKKRDPKDRA
ncbi:MAG: hypothetical protein JSR85_01420 [Proteobacteria bacterium]|nr:hypothetical protein [Pseudomonadota bacterium]